MLLAFAVYNIVDVGIEFKLRGKSKPRYLTESVLLREWSCIVCIIY